MRILIIVSCFALVLARQGYPEPRRHEHEHPPRPEVEIDSEPQVVPEPRPVVPPVVPEPRQGCKFTHVFSAVNQAGSLQSQNYPNEYPPNYDCIYIFDSPAGTQIELSTIDFNVESSQNCVYDSFYISVLGRTDFSDRESHCGRKTFVRISVSNRIVFGFKSDINNPVSSIPYAWKINIKVIPSSAPAPVSPVAPVAPTFKNCACGRRNESPKIVGGKESLINEVPWRVGLSQSGQRGYFCGGTIINERYIMTAAHCTAEHPAGAPLYVTCGDHDTTVTSETRNTTVLVKRIIDHENYDDNNMDNDITLLELATPLVFGRECQPACLPWDIKTTDFSGKPVISSGWGTLSSGGSQPTKHQIVDLNVLAQSQCRSYYSSTQITNNMICTYNPGKDTCQGDSGGSIDYKDEKGRYCSVGVVSWGVGCALERRPGVYARTTNYLDWIVRNSDGNFCNA